MRARWLVVLVGSLLAVGACSRDLPEPGTRAPSPQGTQDVKSIGTAKMLTDGTVVLDLHTSSGPPGHGRVTYAPDDPRYRDVIEHIGGLKPGEQKPVPPWPDNIDDARVEEAVHAHVAKSRGWDRGTYHVEIVGTDGDGNIAVTVARGERGGSFALRIHPATHEVVREIPVR